MPKEEWGTKRVCPTTGKRFYDLNKDPIVSPYTGEVLQLDTGKRAMLVADSADGAKRRASEDDVEDVDLLEDRNVGFPATDFPEPPAGQIEPGPPDEDAPDNHDD